MTLRRAIAIIFLAAAGCSDLVVGYDPLLPDLGIADGSAACDRDASVCSSTSAVRFRAARRLSKTNSSGGRHENRARSTRLFDRLQHQPR